MDSFSKGQKRIAAYILENYDKAAFMTASRLGLLAEVSESTVVRFASELGYDGYLSLEYERRWHPMDIPEASVGMKAGADYLRKILEKRL